MKFDKTKPLDFENNYCSLEEWINSDVEDVDGEKLVSMLGAEAVRMGKIKQYENEAIEVAKKEAKENKQIKINFN